MALVGISLRLVAEPVRQGTAETLISEALFTLGQLMESVSHLGRSGVHHRVVATFSFPGTVRNPVT